MVSHRHSPSHQSTQRREQALTSTQHFFLLSCFWTVENKEGRRDVNEAYVQLLCALPAGCDDLVNAVYELAKGFSRLQLSDEEMALFSAAVLLSPGDYSKNAP